MILGGVHFAPHVKNAPKFHRIYKIARKRFLQNFKIRLFFQNFWTPLKIGTKEKIEKIIFSQSFEHLSDLKKYYFQYVTTTVKELLGVVHFSCRVHYGPTSPTIGKKYRYL